MTAKTEEVFVNSGFGHNTRQPFVSLKVRDVAIMVSPEDARQIAHNLLAGADAAESDGFLIEFMTKDVGMSLEQATPFLLKFRQYRQNREQTS